MKPCENCGHVERIYFQCPACGVSFEVKSETSQLFRLFSPVS